MHLLSITVRNGLAGTGIVFSTTRSTASRAARGILPRMENACLMPVAVAVAVAEVPFLVALRIRRYFPAINSATILAQAAGQDVRTDQLVLITMERNQVMHLTSLCSIMVSGLDGIGTADRITVSLAVPVSS